MRNKAVAAIAIAYVAGSIIVPAAHAIKVHVQERKKRAEIEENKDRSIEAIHLAGEAMKEMIAEGLYDNKLYQVQSDFNELVKLYQSK